MKPGDVIAYRIGGPGNDWTVALVLAEPTADGVRVWDASLLDEYVTRLPESTSPNAPWSPSEAALDSGYEDWRGGQKVRRVYRDLIREARKRYGFAEPPSAP